MKILWLSHFVPYPPKGGMLQRSFNLLREVSRDHEIWLLNFIQRAPLLRSFGSIEEGLRVSHTELLKFVHRAESVPIPDESRRLGRQRTALRALFSPEPYSIKWLRSTEYQQRLDDLLCSTEFDVVHLDTISLAPYLSSAGNMVTMLTHHNIESQMLRRRASNERNPLMKLYFLQEAIRLEAYERRLCQKVSLNIVCSDLDAERLHHIAPGARFTVAPNSVDIEYFQPNSIEPDPNVLTFAGGMTWYPNRSAMQFFFREVWPLLTQRVPDVHFDLIGASPPEDIIALAAQDSRIRVHGFVDDIRPYVGHAGIYVCPIFDGGGTRLKILDAFAMAKAVVAHPMAMEGLHAEPERHYLPASSAMEFVTQIERLNRDERMRRALGEHARMLVEGNFSASAIGRRLSREIDECAHHRS